MGKVLKVDGTVDSAYVFEDLGSDETDCWVTFRVRFDAAALTALATAAEFLVRVEDSTTTLTDTAGIIDLSPPVSWFAQFGDGPSPAPTADEWHTVELHHAVGGTCHLYVDGVLVVSAADSTGTLGSSRFTVGMNGTPAPDLIVYYDDVKIGTSRGADDLFADDFESGDVSAWDFAYGDYEVIDDPFPVSEPQGVCIALTADTLEAAPEWTRLDDPDGYNVASTWTIQRGRSSEMDKTGTGIATIGFKDTDGLLDPTNTTSPFYNTGGTATYLDPMRQVAISLRHPISGTWFPLFRGYLSAQDHDMDMWSDTRGVDEVTWECADAFDLLAALILTPGTHGDDPGITDFADVYYHGIPPGITGGTPDFCHVDDRINQLLDDAGWPAELRDIFSGNVSVRGKVYDRTDQLLASLFDAADAEFPGVANICMTKDGILNFRGRFARFNPTNPGYGINTWYAGGMPEALAAPGTVAPIAGLRFRRSKDDIINSVTALPEGVSDTDAVDNHVSDVTSIGRFGYRSESFTDLQTNAGHDDDDNPTDDLEETLKFAEYYLGNYKDPKTRVSNIRFRTRSPEDVTAPALWDLMCGVEIGDRIHLQTTHVGGGGFDEFFYVEGIRYDARGATDAYHDITLELEVSPASFFAYNPFGTLDSGTI